MKKVIYDSIVGHHSQLSKKKRIIKIISDFCEKNKKKIESEGELIQKFNDEYPDVVKDIIELESPASKNNYYLREIHVSLMYVRVILILSSIVAFILLSLSLLK